MVGFSMRQHNGWTEVKREWTDSYFKAKINNTHYFPDSTAKMTLLKILVNISDSYSLSLQTTGQPFSKEPNQSLLLKQKQ